ncbi:bifunctional DNA-binding transcriptional regulator/O6-methylguanine-DNA methyltransferase Ada [Rubinisphaera margarita]|uniref:bifunctional DNA-binding transcriptional regulator/O6-methylguanine-DNA methyltransferase Ada n=1 Tax=Rubinisphaera margarita TaxID=2909586 RepID=UPI001EE7CE03|nr:bifunctional DNA-binding transcriptional regulator/O6-methylguanine-DNA methyltransferase Ada [Rubinisphaera margarita]MCG6157604.1 bifunctional DNA-binding transcriptional regulator/O6-methylguanine-DNA methyltransferase Ada [Rubinisphaera margarita]
MPVNEVNNSNAFITDDARWQAIVSRDAAADRRYYYGVRTTGVYCRNVCASRQPSRKNVRFFASRQTAEAAGFRPCKRCRPDDEETNGEANAIERACRLIENAERVPSQTELAAAVGFSPTHFHRLFRRQTGLTPRQYAAGLRDERLRTELAAQKTVQRAMESAGFATSSRLYAATNKALGMQPSRFRTGGAGETIRFAVGECWLGSVLVAATSLGVCRITLGKEPEPLLEEFQQEFTAAELIGDDPEFEQTVAVVIRFITTPAAGLDLPLDIRGTAFQLRVWQAVSAIPPGTTVTYTDLAERLGCPESARAVASAVGKNHLAVAIPCHRVIRRDGSLAGYRWGLERKVELLNRER